MTLIRFPVAPEGVWLRDQTRCDDRVTAGVTACSERLAAVRCAYKMRSSN